MAQMQKLEGQVEVRCSADKMFEAVMCKQANIPSIAPCKVSKIQAHCWTSPGSIRKWHCIIDGKKHSITERIEEVDRCNRTVTREMIEGDMLKHYTSLSNKIEVIPTGRHSCLMKYSLYYEKVCESAPEPCQLLNFALGLMKDIGCHLSH